MLTWGRSVPIGLEPGGPAAEPRQAALGARDGGLRSATYPPGADSHCGTYGLLTDRGAWRDSTACRPRVTDRAATARLVPRDARRLVATVDAVTTVSKDAPDRRQQHVSTSSPGSLPPGALRHRARQRGGLPLRLHRRRRRRCAARRGAGDATPPTCRRPCAGPASTGPGRAPRCRQRAVRRLERRRRRHRAQPRADAAVEIDPATRTSRSSSRARSTSRSSRPPPSTGSGTRPTRRRSRSARSAATSRPTPAACAASSTASPPTTCSASTWCSPTAPLVTPRRPADQGRRRALAAQALRRQRGHARHRHPGDPAARARAAAAARPSSPPSTTVAGAAEAVVAIGRRCGRRC